MSDSEDKPNNLSGLSDIKINQIRQQINLKIRHDPLEE